MFCACSSGPSDNSTFAVIPIIDSGSEHDTSPPDSGAIIDSGVEEVEAAPYNGCVSQFTKTTDYARLTANYCIDSNEKEYLIYYTDSNFVPPLECMWDNTSDGIRCIPGNTVSSFLYIDDICTSPITMMPVNHTDDYIGLRSSSDVIIYVLGNALPTINNTIYYKSLINGAWRCMKTQSITLPGYEWYNVGKEASPTLFVKQRTLLPI